MADLTTLYPLVKSLKNTLAFNPPDGGKMCELISKIKQGTNEGVMDNTTLEQVLSHTKAGKLLAKIKKRDDVLNCAKDAAAHLLTTWKARIFQHDKAGQGLDRFSVALDHLDSKGFVKLPLPKYCSHLVDHSWAECSGFLDYWMLRHPSPVNLIKDLPPLVESELPPVQLGADTLAQRKLHCLVLGDFGPGDKRSKAKIGQEYTGGASWMGPGMSAKIPVSSGMGVATSYFGGESHVELQCRVARDVLQPLYARAGTGSIPQDLVDKAEAAAAEVLTQVNSAAAVAAAEQKRTKSTGDSTISVPQLWRSCLEKQKPKHTKPRVGLEKTVETFVSTMKAALAQVHDCACVCSGLLRDFRTLPCT
jgi:hypothetical protein